MTASGDVRATELMEAAHLLIASGDWPGAASALEEAARLHGESGRPYDAARCLQLAATLRRAGGDTAASKSLLSRADAIEHQDTPLAVAIECERMETSFAEGRFADVIRHSTEALALGRSAGLKADGLSAILRRRAAALVCEGRIRDASDDYDEAFGLLPGAHGEDVGAFLRVEQADTLLRYGYRSEAARLVDSIPATTEHVRAEILVLRARLARLGGDLNGARELAREARQAALETIAPVTYFAACVEMAESYRASGDAGSAYGTLATACATLSDVLGREAASSWVEPILLSYQILWGDEKFGDAKRAYDAERRAGL